MTDVSYVRTEMLTEQPAPVSQAGVVGWVRTNLFSSPANSVLTIVALLFTIYVLKGLISWAFVPTWNTASLNECREILLGMGREGHFGGACWGIIRDRWVQLFFGFYPADQYWRILLAFVLMLVALAPVLFQSLPRAMLWFSAIFPFFFPWMLWGGNVWLPILVIVGLVLGYVAFRVLFPSLGQILSSLIGILVVILWWMFGVSLVNTALNSGITASRFDGLKTELAQTVDTLKAPIAENEARIKELVTAIETADAEKAETIVTPLEAVAEQLHENELARLGPASEAESGGGRSGRLLRVLGAIFGGLLPKSVHPEDVELVAERQGYLEQLLPQLDKSIALREERTSIASKNGQMVAELDEASSLLQGLEALPDLKSERSQETDPEQIAVLNARIQAIEAEAGLVGLKPVPSTKFGGFALSIIIGVAAILLSLPLGILLALGRQSNLLIVKSICVGFIEFIRGVPLITLLFVASTLLNYFMPPGTNFDIILRVVIMVTLFASAYMAEVIRGGLAALPRGQYEGADSLGLDYWQAQRLIIMPQALKISIPGIVSTFIGVFKDTVLVSIIGLLDPLGLSNAIRADQAWNGVVWELYAFIALMFFIFCFSMSRYSMYLERKLQTGHR